MKAGVALEREGQVRAEGRMSPLILDHLELGSERESRGKILEAGDIERDSGGIELLE